MFIVGNFFDFFVCSHTLFDDNDILGKYVKMLERADFVELCYI